MILAIDPGTTHSGMIWYDEAQARVAFGGTATPPKAAVPNEDVLDLLRRCHPATVVVCEWIESFGMAVGREVFLTVRWIGRFEEARAQRGGHFHTVTRRDVKLHLCGSARAKDPNVRQAILDRFGGREAIGRKKTPGPLYGVSSHAWSALAVALTFADNLVDTTGTTIRRELPPELTSAPVVSNPSVEGSHKLAQTSPPRLSGDGGPAGEILCGARFDIHPAFVCLRDLGHSGEHFDRGLTWGGVKKPRPARARGAFR